jgi:hypothetical protein
MYGTSESSENLVGKESLSVSTLPKLSFKEIVA